MRYALIPIFLLGFILPAAAQSGLTAEVNPEVDQTAMDSARVEWMVKKADTLKRAGEMSRSMDLLERSRQIADTLDNPYLTQLVVLQLADNFIARDQPDSAENILVNTLRQFPSGEKRAQLASMLGNAYRYQGRFEEALQRQKEARALVDSSEYPGIHSRINLNTASVYESMGNYGTALKYYLRSIEGAEAQQDTLLLATGLNNLGVAYNNYSDPEKARHYLRRASEMYRNLNDQVGLLRTTTNLAISANKLGDYEESVSMYRQALDIHERVRSDTPPFRILYNLAQVYKKQGKLEKAESNYRKSLEYCRGAGIPQGLIYNYGGLGNVAELRGDTAKAAEYYGQALDTARQIKAAELERSALNSLYQLEKKRGNFREALSYHESLTSLSDSLQKIARQQELDETEAQLSLRRQEEVNRLLKEKQEQQQSRIAAQNWLIAAGAGIIIVILISMYLLYRSNVERREINAELESQRKRLEELNRVKEKMLAVISHDLRSPMTSMQGLLYLLRENDLSREEISEMAAKLEVSLKHNINMMDNMLVWAREQMSGLELDPEKVNAHGVAANVIDNNELQADDKGIRLLNRVPEDLTVEADKNLLELILRNLISNSIKFSREGDEVIVQAEATANDRVVFRVSDTGIGIPEEKQEKLFSMNGGSREGTGNEKGSGLGLKLCREFVEKQGGEIDFETAEGEGTTFTFSLGKP